MRLWLLLAPILLAGCSAPGPPPPHGGNQGALPLPPGLLVDRFTPRDFPRSDPGAEAAETLQVFVHAKHGNVRYDFINVTEFNDFEWNLTWHSFTETYPGHYAVDLDLGKRRVNLTIDVLAGDAAFRWSGRLLLNETSPRPAVRVEPFGPLGEALPPFEAALPWETLLQRVPEGGA